MNYSRPGLTISSVGGVGGGQGSPNHWQIPPSLLQSQGRGRSQGKSNSSNLGQARNPMGGSARIFQTLDVGDICEHLVVSIPLAPGELATVLFPLFPSDHSRH